MIQEVPLFSPVAELAFCQDVLTSSIERVIRSGQYVSGNETRYLEEATGNYFGVNHAVGVASGTMALELLLRADNVGKGDRVVTSANTFVAVLEAILTVGAEPHFVDIDPLTWQMAAGDWCDEVVMACHLYGGTSKAVFSEAAKVYEDASQSLGAVLNGRPVGTLTRAAAVSLYPTKNLAALGDAGIILTNDTDLAAKLRAMRNHGQTEAQVHTYHGTTGRMDEIQAAILNDKLKVFPQFVQIRRKSASFYREHLSHLPIEMPILEEESAPNLFVIATDQRDALRGFLRERRIGTGIHYPTPLHLMPAYRDAQWAQIPLPNTEALCRRILSLPLWVGISSQEQAYVVRAVNDFYGEPNLL